MLSSTDAVPRALVGDETVTAVVARPASSGDGVGRGAGRPDLVAGTADGEDRPEDASDVEQAAGRVGGVRLVDVEQRSGRNGRPSDRPGRTGSGRQRDVGVVGGV